LSPVLTRIALWCLALVILCAAVLGGEIFVALRRDYLATSPVLELDGRFGSGATRITFVVLGDSTAAGVGAGSVEQAYPTLLARRLAREGHPVRLIGLGVAGARVSDVLHRQVQEATRVAPNLFFIGIGANDVTHLTPLGDIRRDCGAIVDKLRATGAAVVVAGPPDMRAPAFLEPLRSLAGWRGRAVAGVIEEVATQRDVATVELARVTGPLFARDPERYHSADDFHPSAAGYELWADAIYPVLERAVEDTAEGASVARGDE
jgi:lysophospholipase L1-like esterase